MLYICELILDRNKTETLFIEVTRFEKKEVIQILEKAGVEVRAVAETYELNARVISLESLFDFHTSTRKINWANYSFREDVAALPEPFRVSLVATWRRNKSLLPYETIC